MSKANRRQMKLGVFVLTAGHHIAAWRHPDTEAGDRLAHFVTIAREAEAAKLDLVFISDTLAARLDNYEAACQSANIWGSQIFEPVTLMAALAAVTSRIGLVGTASTTYTEPYNLARQFASLDHMSDGRAGWNIVTTADQESAWNMGTERPDHEVRYARAEEFVDAVRGLWDSWDDDAFVRDQRSGLYFDPAKVHRLNYRGEHIATRGPMNIPRPPQGHPVLVQAGASGPGKNLAARVADVVFTAHVRLEDAQNFYRDVKARAAGFGRSPGDVLIMPGINPIIGETEAEARAKFDALQSYLTPEIALNTLMGLVNEIDLRQYPLDGPVPEMPETQGMQSRQKLVLDLARSENLTLGQLAMRFAGARGHWMVVGTATQVADQMEEFFVNEGADGFNLLLPAFPGSLRDFNRLVVPELQRRGLFRTDYEGDSLRANLGLRRPESSLRGTEGLGRMPARLV